RPISIRRQGSKLFRYWNDCAKRTASRWSVRPMIPRLFNERIVYCGSKMGGSPMEFRLAFRNVLRHRTRSIVSMLSIAMGVVSLVIAGGFIEDTIRQVREWYIGEFLGHIRICKVGYRQNALLHPFDYMISDPQTLLKKLRATPHVDYVDPTIT